MTHPIRGRLSTQHIRPRDGESYWLWNAEVFQGNTLLWHDNCRDPSKLEKDFTEVLKAFKVLDAKGQVFQSWNEICSNAPRL